MTISLVISSRTAFDVDLVSAALGVPPTKIWRRRENLVVHGPDTIPMISWIFERDDETEVLPAKAICDLLDPFNERAAQLTSIARTLALETTVVCRTKSRDLEQEIDLPSSVLARLVQFGAGIVWSMEYEGDGPR